MGKYTSDKAIIIAGLSTVGIIITALFISVQRKKKIIKQLEAKIDLGISSAGNFTDMENSKAFDAAYWKVSGSANLLTAQKAVFYAKQLFAYYNREEAWELFGKDLTKAQMESDFSKSLNPLSIFEKMKNQAQISQVVSAYSKYGYKLYTDIVDKKSSVAHFVDFLDNLDVLGLWSYDTLSYDSKQIYNYIKDLPLK